MSLFAAGILLLGGTGCQTYTPRPLEVEPSAQAFAQQTLDDPAIREALGEARLGRPDLAAPWTTAQLLVVAETVHPSIARARAQWAARRAGVDVAEVRPPVGIHFDLQRATSGASPWTYGFTLDGLIELGDKRARREAAARVELNQAALALARTTWAVDLAVERALVRWRVADARQRALAPLAASLQDWSEIERTRAELGEGNRLDALVVDHERHQLALELAAAKEELAVARAALAGALGLPPSALEGVEIEDLSTDPPPTPEHDLLWDEAARRHPDILASLADYAGREASLRLALAGQYPDLQLGPGYAFDQGQHKWILGFGFTLPIDRNRAAIAQARAELEVGVAAFRETQAAVLGSLDEAFARYRGGRAQLALADALATTSEEAVETQARRLELGEGDRLALVQAQVQARRDQLARADARAAAWDAWLQLQTALGAPLEPFSSVSR